jgi:hypothetical protein
VADHLSAAARNEVPGAGDRASRPSRKRDPWREGWRLGLPPRNAILGVEDGGSFGGPETGDSACRVAAREARNEAWRFAFPSGKFAAWWRYGGGMAGSTGGPGGGSLLAGMSNCAGVRGRCAAVPERTVALQELTLRWQTRPATGRPPERVGSDAPRRGIRSRGHWRRHRQPRRARRGDGSDARQRPRDGATVRRSPRAVRQSGRRAATSGSSRAGHTTIFRR